MGLVGYGKFSPPRGFDPLTVQPVTSRYTDYAIPAAIIMIMMMMMMTMMMMIIIIIINPIIPLVLSTTGNIPKQTT